MTTSVHRRMYPNFSLQDKVYIVTGAGPGPGLAMAEAMTEAGAHGIYLHLDHQINVVIPLLILFSLLS